MFQAIFQILKDEKSLELIMASYQLLNELYKHFPWVYVPKTKKSESPPASTEQLELLVVEEAWSPFNFGTDYASGEKEEAIKNCSGSLDPSGFHLLIQDLAQVAEKEKSEALATKALGAFLVRSLGRWQPIIRPLLGMPFSPKCYVEIIVLHFYCILKNGDSQIVHQLEECFDEDD
ncbi:unnamed protein product [Ilex paraguariensis]|uniref:Uncharacterized protein n=1 Tax=Ilex paraguariensis TaxID=185542 RepID=A0ABC8S5R5_9AQUA